MKRCLTVSAFCLILTLMLGGELSARNTPYYPQTITTTNPNGDDHPWGGDQSSGGSLTTTTRPRLGSAATLSPLQRFLRYVALQWNFEMVVGRRGVAPANNGTHNPHPSQQATPPITRGEY